MTPNNFLLASAVVAVISLRLVRIRKYIRVDKGDSYLFSAAIVCLIGTFLGMVGTAAVPISENNWVHGAAAFIGFTCAIVMLVILSILDDRLRIIRREILRKVRIGLSAFLVLFGVLTAIVSFWSTITGAIFEVLAVIAFSIYFVTYGDSSEFPLTSSAEPHPPDPDPIASTPPH